MQIADYIDADLLDKFEFHNYNHAIEIITQAFPEEWREVVECLRKLDITTDDLREAGGNETKIPKKFDDVLYPYGWREIRISGDLHIKFYPRQADQRGRFSSVPFEERVTENYIDGHNIDFLKGRIAFDLEWNSKDQTLCSKPCMTMIRIPALGSLLCVNMAQALLGWGNCCIA